MFASWSEPDIHSKPSRTAQRLTKTWLNCSMLTNDWEPCVVSAIARSYQLWSMYRWDMFREPKRRAMRKYTVLVVTAAGTTWHNIIALDAITLANLLGRPRQGTLNTLNYTLLRKYWYFSFWCTVSWRLDHDLPKASVNNLLTRWYSYNICIHKPCQPSESQFLWIKYTFICCIYI